MLKFSFRLPERNNKIFSGSQDFRIIREAGSGGFSTVYLAEEKKTGKQYALKKIEFLKLSNLDQENVQKEIEIHKDLDSPYVIKLIDFFKEDQIVYLILEYLEKGNLYDYILKRARLPMKELKSFFKDISEAIKYLHEKNIIMRDLKPENCLLDENKNIKLCDFGWAVKMDDIPYRTINAGTLVYMSPESLRGEIQNLSSDLWSLGILLYELFFINLPFFETSIQNMLNKIGLNKIDFSSGFIIKTGKNLIDLLLVIDSEKRITIDDVLMHPFLTTNEYIIYEPKSDKKVDKKLIRDHSSNNISVKPKIHQDKKLKKSKKKLSVLAHSNNINLKRNSKSKIDLEKYFNPELYKKEKLINKNYLKKNTNPNLMKQDSNNIDSYLNFKSLNEVKKEIKKMKSTNEKKIKNNNEEEKNNISKFVNKSNTNSKKILDQNDLIKKLSNPDLNNNHINQHRFFLYKPKDKKEKYQKYSIQPSNTKDFKIPLKNKMNKEKQFQFNNFGDYLKNKEKQNLREKERNNLIQNHNDRKYSINNNRKKVSRRSPSPTVVIRLDSSISKKNKEDRKDILIFDYKNYPHKIKTKIENLNSETKNLKEIKNYNFLNSNKDNLNLEKKNKIKLLNNKLQPPIKETSEKSFKFEFMKSKNLKRKILYNKTKNKYFQRNLSQNIIKNRDGNLRKNNSNMRNEGNKVNNKYMLYNRNNQKLKKDPTYFTNFLPNNMRIVNKKLDDKMKHIK